LEELPWCCPILSDPILNMGLKGGKYYGRKEIGSGRCPGSSQAIENGGK